MSAAAEFESDRVAWIADPAEAERRLGDGELEVLGYITSASNGTLLCRLGDGGCHAVYKPAVGERPLWDFPDGTLHRREVATAVVSRLLGWDLIPPTVLRDGPQGRGSLQLFVPHDPNQHYFELAPDPRWHAPLAQLAMFDILTNNADRKGSHVLRHATTDRLYGIDNGLTFHVETKLRTVVWDVPHVPFAEAWRADVRRLCEGLNGGPEADELGELLSATEVAVLAGRAEAVLALESIPEIHPDRRHYPWPPL